MTVALAVSLSLPPAPAQVTVTLNVPVFDGVKDFLPDVAVEPIDRDPPHEIAFVDDQLSVVLLPSVMEPGLNQASTVGGGSFTVTLAVSLSLAPSPVHVTVTLNVPALAGVYSFVPDVAVEPIDRDPLHALALFDDQFSVTSSPRVIELSSNHALTSTGGGTTGTLAVALSSPPSPVHVTVTLNLPALAGVYSFVPDVSVEPIDGSPLHAPALLDDQVNVTLSPRMIELSPNDAVTVGRGSMTVTSAVALRLPPAPVHVTVTLNLPAFAGVYFFVPDLFVEPIDGEPLHALAFFDDQVNVTLSPRMIELSPNDAVTVGRGSMTVAPAVALPLPPAPVHVTVTLNLPALAGVYSFVPDVSVEPIDGEPLHALAFFDDQVSSTLSPRVMELSSNDALTVGAGVGAGVGETVTVSAV